MKAVPTFVVNDFNILINELFIFNFQYKKKGKIFQHLKITVYCHLSHFSFLGFFCFVLFVFQILTCLFFLSFLAE